jgi:hypothetical protein
VNFARARLAGSKCEVSASETSADREKGAFLAGSAVDSALVWVIHRGVKPLIMFATIFPWATSQRCFLLPSGSLKSQAIFLEIVKFLAVRQSKNLRGLVRQQASQSAERKFGGLRWRWSIGFPVCA